MITDSRWGDLDPLERVEAAFDEFDDEYLEFDRVEHKLSLRQDLHAMLLLERIIPGEKARMISAAEHDVVYLDVLPSVLGARATDDEILELRRSGVCYDSDVESFYFNV